MSALIGPVCDAAVIVARGSVASFAFFETIGPESFARGSVDCNRGALGSRGEIQLSVDGERGDFQVEVGARAKVLRLPPPRDLELVYIGCVDLIQRRILRASRVAADISPVCSVRSFLRPRSKRQGGKQCADRQHLT